MTSSSTFRSHAAHTLTVVGAVVAFAALAACGEGATGPQVPAPVAGAAHYGEGLFDAAYAGSWPAATAQLDTLRQRTSATGGSAAPAALGAALSREVAVLDTAVPRRNRGATLRSANEVTRIAAELTRSYNPPLPVEITLLDYDGRELLVWSEANDPARLRESAALLRKTWDAVRPRVAARPGGGAAASAFERLVVEAEAARTPAGYAAVAQRILDDVDRLEGLFPKSDTPD